MSQPVIQVEGIAKHYRIGRAVRHESFREAAARMLAAPVRRLRSFGRVSHAHDVVEALRDVSFDIHEGEVVGVIGPNGAGKSTLLRVLSRITEPSAGRAVMRGRVASLLEVGTGFHPELTGRENVFLSGAILGMSRAELRRHFDEIVDFSGIERFIDTPIKRYSSGMRVRLGFSVAAFLQAEIMLIDEVLAVGDTDFRHKCLAKMQSVSRSGRTILFVSHNLRAVEQLCDRTLLIEGGRLAADGRSEQVIADYKAEDIRGGWEIAWPDAHRAPGNEHVRLTGARLLGPDGRPRGRFTTDEPIDLEIEYRVLQSGPALGAGFMLHDAEGNKLFGSSELHAPSDGRRSREPGHYVCRCRIPSDLMAPGQAFVELRIIAPHEARWLAVREPEALALEVAMPPNRTAPIGVGLVAPMLEWEVRKK